MTDLAKLKALAEAANASVALKMQGVSFWVSSGGVFGTPQTAIDDFQTQANPSVVLGLIAENERLKSEIEAFQTANRELSEINVARRNHLANAKKAAGIEWDDDLVGAIEGLLATASIKAVLAELDDALENLEIHGRHSDQGYRKLKDWYRKMILAFRVVEAPVFNVEHGELVSQNTWLRKIVESYAQQHAPLEEIPDSDGWSTRLPGYDLPSLLRDAERYRYSRDIAYSAITEEGHRIIVELPMPSCQASGAGEYLDISIDAAMGKGERS